MKQGIKNKQKIKAIVFDVGGVLQLGKHSQQPVNGHYCLGVHEYMARKLKISLDQWFDSIDTPYADSIEGKVSRAKAISVIAKNVKTDKNKLIRIIHKAYRKNFKKNKKLYGVAFKLKKKGYKIGILSDQWYLSKDVLMPEKDTKGFDPVVVSCDVGVRKPDVKIYKMVMKKLRLKASEILFIDNQKWNLVPAKKLGMKVILFEGNRKCIKGLRGLGVL